MTEQTMQRSREKAYSIQSIRDAIRFLLAVNAQMSPIFESLGFGILQLLIKSRPFFVFFWLYTASNSLTEQSESRDLSAQAVPSVAVARAIMSWTWLLWLCRHGAVAGPRGCSSWQSSPFQAAR